MDWISSGDLPQKDDLFYEKIDEDLDLAFALSLQEEFNENAIKEVLTKDALVQVGSTTKSSKSANPIGIVDAQWELIDPHPDIHALFIQFNAQYFYGKLHGVEVKWSPRMTLCAGVCSYEGRGGLCSVRLSSPLLKLRPRRDLVETLLHEMIHAYLFVTANNKDHDAHGPEFLSHMYRINKETGTNISVYHSFHDEVDYFRKHWWKCNGPCAKRRPFYGVVKRAMNRAPGPKDRWWPQHQETCGGIFQKIKEPQDYKQKSSKRKNTDESAVNKNAGGIKNFFPSVPSTSQVPDSYNALKKKKGEVNIQTIKSIFEKENNVVPMNSLTSTLTSVPANSSTFSGKGFTLGTSSLSQQPTSFLSKIRREIGYPNSQTVKPHASTQSSRSFSSNATVPSSKNTKPNISVQSSRNTKPNMSAQSSQNSKPNMSAQNSQSSKSNISAQSSRNTKPNMSAQNSQSSKSNISAQSSQVEVSKNKKLLGTSDSSSKKGLNSFLMDSQTSASNTSKRKLLQSSIDSFVTSPVRTSNEGFIQTSNTTKREAVEIIRNIVICPVCFIDVPSEIINRHLDGCLNKCS